MRIKTSETFESCFYIGSRRGYAGEPFAKQDLIKVIHDYQDAHYPETLPVRITDCCFVAKDGYIEDGWEVSSIQYPNVPKSCYEVGDFSLLLATHLLNYFSQNRITIRPSTCSRLTIMLEADNAEVRK